MKINICEINQKIKVISQVLRVTNAHLSENENIKGV